MSALNSAWVQVEIAFQPEAAALQVGNLAYCYASSKQRSRDRKLSKRISLPTVKQWGEKPIAKCGLLNNNLFS